MLKPNTIIVASAVILSADAKVLLVRKQNTQYFMQVGGKLETNESAESALKREIKEEISCDVQSMSFIATHHTQAANEAGFDLLSHTFFVEIQGKVTQKAEIEEIIWLDIWSTVDLPLAPLTRDHILPWCKNYLLASQTAKA